MIIDDKTVARLLDPIALIDALAPAMGALSRGEVSLPARIAAMIEEKSSLLAAMPVYLASQNILAAKLVSVFPGNAALGLDTHHATILLFDAGTGKAIAMMDGARITAERTAAGSALATRLVSKTDAKVLAILGAGVQARAHAMAIPRVRDISQILIAGRDPGKAAALVDELSGETKIAVDIADFETAVRAADIICTTTHAPEPVLDWSWITPGSHINAVGFNPGGREIDAQTVANSTVFVEARSSVLAPSPSGANELLWPIRDGVIDENHIQAEIGELVNGTREGRLVPDEVTLYKSVGVGVQDAVSADLVYALALEQGRGIEIDLS